MNYLQGDVEVFPMEDGKQTQPNLSLGSKNAKKHLMSEDEMYKDK